MTSKSIYDRYSPSLVPETANDKPAWFFVFNKDKLLVKAAADTLIAPFKTTVDELKLRILETYYLGKLDGCDCYCIETDETEDLPEGMFFKRFISLLERIDAEIFALAGRGYQILNWDKKNRFCGSCGFPTERKADEWAKVCQKCGNVIYPKISPAVIVGVIKENQILLAHSKNFKEKFFSIIAGFVEPGETFEDCIKREVYEEVGLKVKNLKYFGSQPWPFPDSLMVGFTAEYESGEIIVDGIEITAAGWYTGDNLPNKPTNASIAGRIIEWFSENY
jgi:NAD+ diphosphatase